MQTPERLPSPVSGTDVGELALPRNLERTQQYRTNKRKRGKDRQHVKLQGKVH
jgi:hypothetical protein